jgi:HAD superfamily hydrolase (TIGR01509 family)
MSTDLLLKRTPALVIFDCDGVIVDSEQISHSVLHAQLLEGGVAITYEETVERFIGTSPAGFVAHVTELFAGEMPADFVDRFREATFAAFDERLVTVAGVEAVLRSLQVPHCVASNGPHFKLRTTLGRTGLLDYFGPRIFSFEDVARPKPAPDLFLHAARTLGTDPAACIVVEDTPTGIRAARAAGMRALGYAAMTPPQRLLDAGAHAVFADMQDLPALLHLD